MSSTAEDPIDWYILRNRQQSGPYTRAFVRDAARGGGLSRHDLVWRPGWAEWRDAGAVDGIFDAPEIGMENPSLPRPPLVRTSMRQWYLQRAFVPAPHRSQPGLAAPPAANYLVRHWRGELTLPMAYWVSGIASNFVSRFISGVSDFVITHNDLSAVQYAFVSAVPVLADFVIIPWMLVGVWRSASRHKTRGGRVFWAWLAKSIVIVTAVADLAAFTYFSLPDLSENVRVAFEELEGGTGANSFRLMRDGTELEFSGEIVAGSARGFAQSLDASPQVKVLHLNSIGGRIGEADAIAAKVTNRGLVTYVSDECMSACTHIFLAGRQRWLGEQAKLGFHRPYARGVAEVFQRQIADHEREYLIELGLPTNFAAKVTATPPASMWYPNRDELLRAHVISGVAEAGRFADSGVSAELEAILLRVPIYASMKKALPKIFEAFASAVSQEHDGATAEQILSSADEQFTEVVNNLLPHAPDRLVLEHTSVYVDFLDKLRSIDPESCAALAEVDGAEAKVDLKRQFPELSRRELAFREALIVSTDPDGPIPTESQVQPQLSGVIAKIQRQFGNDADLLGKDAPEPHEYPRLCEVLAGFYREIMRLPDPQAAEVLRYVYSEK